MRHMVILTGGSGHGKDTLGRQLVEQFGYTRFSFGDSLRRIVIAKYGQPYSDDERSPDCYDGISFKQMMLNEGKLLSLADPIRLARELRHQIATQSTGPVVVTDCRKPIELHMLRQIAMPSWLVVVNRPDCEYAANRLDGLLNEACDAHVIVNDGTPADMLSKLSYILETKLPYGWNN